MLQRAASAPESEGISIEPAEHRLAAYLLAQPREERRDRAAEKHHIVPPRSQTFGEQRGLGFLSTVIAGGVRDGDPHSDRRKARYRSATQRR